MISYSDSHCLTQSFTPVESLTRGPTPSWAESYTRVRPRRGPPPRYYSIVYNVKFVLVPRPRAREGDKRFGKEPWRRDHLDTAAELLDQADRICVPTAAITWLGLP